MHFRNERLDFKYDSLSVEPSIIRTGLVFNFSVNLSSRGSATNPSASNTLIITDFSAELKQKGQEKEIYAGHLIPKALCSHMSLNCGYGLQLLLELDAHTLSAIEKLREAKDLLFTFHFRFYGEFEGEPQTRNYQDFQLGIRIPKSDWVDNHLPALGFKTASLIEVPQLVDIEFAETIVYVNDAWKQYSMGEYHRVLTDCRKAIECLSDKIKSKGFEKEELLQDGKKKIVPDWDKFLDNEELGDAVATINRKISRITSTGAHPGRIICREDADFALMTTHAMVNLIVRKYNLTCN